MTALLIPREGAAALEANNFNGLRLSMALLVVWSHSFALYFGSEDSEWVSILLNGTYNSGNLAVMAFFVMSGFLITQSFTRSRTVQSYLVKRIRRIYPGYFVAIMVCAFIVVPAYSTVAKIDAVEVAKVILSNLFLRNYLPPSNAFTANPLPNAVNGSLWSIPFEFWCYIGVALLGVAGLITKRWLLVGILLLMLLGRVALDLAERKPALGIIGLVFGPPYLWTKTLPSFMLGMLAFAFRDRLPRSRVLLAMLGAMVMVCAQISAHLTNLILAPAMAYAIFYVAFSRTLRLPDLARYGDFSYGTYLYAFPIQQMIWATWQDDIGFAAYLLLSVVLSLSAGILSWFAVERWFLKPVAPAPALA